MTGESNSKNDIIIYQTKSGPEVKVTIKDQGFWLDQSRIAELFGTQRPAITKHLRNIFKSKELDEKSVSSILEHTAADGKTYKVKYYNLDAIISVGYRINSNRATQFRIWATQKLKELMLKGYAFHEQRLLIYQAKVKELEQARKIFQQALESRRTEGYEKDFLNIITDYLQTWTILNLYDTGKLEIENVSKKAAKYIEYEKAVDAIERFRKRLVATKQATELFGRDTGHRLSGILKSIQQSYGSKDLYPSLEEKAAHLFYFVIKDHPFVDGNKRIGSLLLLLFLVQNHYLYNRKGERKINDAALAALALLVAESKPDQKEVMIRLIVNLINKK
ncbi:MAG TPA: RhuM family protein, partial [Verrucomicrobiae bacterium]|nr:RhuM family protein [Verrucomicrobiae bacterium]